MLLLPRNIPPDIASDLENLFLAPSVEEALRNTANWLVSKFGAESVICLFERGFVGGKRAESTEFVAASNAWNKFTHDQILDLWHAAELHTTFCDQLREQTGSVIYAKERWPVKLEEAYRATFQKDVLFVPVSSELIVTQANERPFFGYFAVFFASAPDLARDTAYLLSLLPEWLSAIISGFIRELTSREDMLGFYSHNVKQHLLLMDALMFHLSSDDKTMRDKLVQKMKNACTRMLLETEKTLLADQEATESFKAHPQTVSLNTLVTDVSTQLQPLFDSAKVTIRPELVDDLPPVQLDPELFPWVIYNLIENAYKFSRRGQKVYVRTKCDKERETVILEVGDYGIGVPEDQKKVIFSKHYRASNVGEIPGNGLGLYLVKKIIDAHHGTVSVVKRPYSKTTFIVELPAATDESR